MGQLERFTIRVKYGDNNTEIKLDYVHKDWAHLTIEEQEAAFDKAVKELEHVYHDYGRFATLTGINNLFDKFGFQHSMR